MPKDEPYDSLPPRRRKALNLRRGLLSGAFGTSYGISAFGYPLGAISGVQTPTDPPLSTDQFGGDAGAGQGSGDAGTAGGDSGGAAAP